MQDTWNIIYTIKIIYFNKLLLKLFKTNFLQTYSTTRLYSIFKNGSLLIFSPRVSCTKYIVLLLFYIDGMVNIDLKY